MKTIYILDDEKPVSDPLSIWFERRHYRVVAFQNTFAFLDALMKEKPCLIIMDIRLLEDDGRMLCRLVKFKYKCDLPIILISASSDLGTDYKDYDADAFIEKPFSFSTVEKTVDSYLAQFC